MSRLILITFVSEWLLKACNIHLCVYYKEKVTRIQEYKNTTRVQEYKSTRVQDYKNTRIQEYKSTRVQDYKITRLQDYKITMIWLLYFFSFFGWN
ncbi:hypothetical protein EBZ38_05220 [bacterium]|nr:hypothetical protein [bacterium]